MARFPWRRPNRRKEQRTRDPRRTRLWLEPLQVRILPATGLTATVLPIQPLSFEANQGQADPSVNYLARGAGFGLFLRPTDAVLTLQPGPAGPGAMLDFQLTGANNNPVVGGLNLQAGVSNYFLGSNPTQWHTNVPTYGAVVYQGVYPGIDVTYHSSNQQQLEYDFVVAAGADPSAIRLTITGAQGLSLDGQGDLLVQSAGGVVVEHAPVVYQTVNGVRQSVSGHYVLAGNNQVGFAVGPYDTTRPLTIDPVLSYSSFLGGNGYDTGTAIAVDGSQNAYVTGYTSSGNFPTTGGAFQQSPGYQNVFRSTDGAGSWSVAASGLPGDNPNAIAVDPSNANDVYAAVSFDGIFRSTDGGGHWTDFNAGLPSSSRVSSVVIDPNSPTTLYGAAGSHVFKSSGGGAWAEADTGLPGSGQLVLDPVHSGTLYIATGSGVYKTTDGAQTWSAATSGLPTSGSFTEGFALAPSQPTTLYIDIFTFTPNLGNRFFTSTDGGGSWTQVAGVGFPRSLFDIGVDPTHPATVYGVTDATAGGVVKTTDGGAHWSVINSGLPANHDVNVLAVDPVNGQTLYAGTFTGVFKSTDGGGNWTAMSNGLTNPETEVIAVAPSNTAVVYTGNPGGTVAFVTKVDANGNLVYSTYLGDGLTFNSGAGIGVDGNGDAYVTGYTDGSNFPTTANAFQTAQPGSESAFVTKLNPTGSMLLYSSYYGGTTGFTDGNAIAVDPTTGNASITGVTGSQDLPTTAGAFQSSFANKEFFRSTDGGATFITKTSGLPPTEIDVEAIDPQTTTTLYAGTTDGVFKSTDAGATWSAASSGLPSTMDVTVLVIDPNTPTTLYAAQGAPRTTGNAFGNGVGVFKSTDGGGSWTAINTGLPANAEVSDIVIDPTSSNTLYLGNFGSGVYKSTNGGSAWSQVGTFANGLPNNFVRSMAIDPEQPNTVYAGESSISHFLAKTTNGGTSWTQLDTAQSNNIAVFLLVDPTNSNTVYMEISGVSVEFAKSTDGGSTFSPAQTGLNSFDFTGLALSASDPSTLYVTNGFGGAYKSTDGAASWSQLTALPNRDAFSVAVDPGNADKVYIGGNARFADEAFVARFNTNAAGAASLVYGTYLGGSGTSEEGASIAIDGSGNAYVTGTTDSLDFPTTAGAFQTALPGFESAFVTKLNPTGTGLGYSTYLGGSSSERAAGIAVDTNGFAYVTGTTYSGDFPTTAGAFQTVNNGGSDGEGVAFVTKFNTSGTDLAYSTYLGGSSGDAGTAVAVDGDGNAYVTGYTYSVDFPTTSNAIQASNNAFSSGGAVAFVTKLNTTATDLVYSTYLGGSVYDQANGIAVDGSGDAYITGYTESTDFPTANAFESAFAGGGSDGFLAKLGPDNNQPSPPHIDTISSTSATEGDAAFTLTVDGDHFTANSVIQFNGTGVTTKFVGGGELTATVPAADLAEEGDITVTVADGDQTSNPATITVNDAPLTPHKQTVGAVVGQGLTNVLVATFDDPGAESVQNGDYSAKVTWDDSGNGTHQSTGRIQLISGHTFGVYADNTTAYTQTGDFGITVNIADGDVTTEADSTAHVVLTTGPVQRGQALGFAYWAGKTGQSLIQSFGDGTALGDWLAANFPRLFGADAGTHNLMGQTDDQVAMFVKSLTRRGTSRVLQDAIATALDIYATTSSLGGTVGARYGFKVSSAGLGAATMNVGHNGAAFGVPNNTTLSIMEIMQAVNDRATNGTPYAGFRPSYATMANDVFQGIFAAGRF